MQPPLLGPDTLPPSLMAAHTNSLSKHYLKRCYLGTGVSLLSPQRPSSFIIPQKTQVWSNHPSSFPHLPAWRPPSHPQASKVGGLCSLMSFTCFGVQVFNIYLSDYLSFQPFEPPLSTLSNSGAQSEPLHFQIKAPPAFGMFIRQRLVLLFKK